MESSNKQNNYENASLYWREQVATSEAAENSTKGTEDLQAIL